MNDPRHPLTPAILEQICAFVRAGGFPQVAAEAAGIPARVFDSWMRYGNARRPVPLSRDFREAAHQAQAMARLAAESRALQRAPLSWLRFGPGRESRRIPGWTDAAKPAPIKREGGGVSLERMQPLVTAMLAALAPFPEARAALAEAVSTFDELKEALSSNPDSTPEPSPFVPPPQTEPQNNAPSPSAPEPEEPPQPVREPTTKAQANDIEATSKAQRDDIEPATKVQPTGNEKTSATPAFETKCLPTPRKQPWNPFEDFPDSAWTTFVWDPQRYH